MAGIGSRITMAQASPPIDADGAVLAPFHAVRSHTEALAAALTPEDQCIQSMPDASPAKWHRAHTTWFFEQFVLRPHAPGYRPYDDAFCFLFNSYYEAVGARHPRATRGLVTRPGVEEVGRYRAHVDAAMGALLDADRSPALRALVTLGLHHEQQHQELLLTDMLHAFAQNPLAWRDAGMAVLPGWRPAAGAAGPTRFLDRPDGLAPSWRRAATAPPPCGCRMAGRWPAGKAGMRRCTGAPTARAAGSR